MSQIGFEIGWLNERFRFDNAARNQKVEETFLTRFEEKDSLTIVDIGSGTGANCLYFLEKLDQDQKWFLIEKDSRFLEPTLQRLSEFANQKGYDFQIGEKSIKIFIVSKNIEIKIINDSFFELPTLLDLKEVDVVMAAAVFDLLSIDQFETLAESIFSNRIDLLTTMNYSAMYFQPVIDLDKQFVNLYESHMNRSQHFGKAMGKYASILMEQYFRKKGYEFRKGKSSWKIESTDFKMHNYLLGYIENSVGEMLNEPKEKKQFKAWLLEKRTLSKNKLLSIEVDHFDFFVTAS